MSNVHITDTARLVEKMMRFAAYVQHKDGHAGTISFRDSNGFLGREEDYKSRIAEEARKALRFSEWKESWIGTGKIAECAAKAISKAGNLVFPNQKLAFQNCLNPQHPNYQKDAERVLFDIYRNHECDDADAFTNAVATFGAKYDTIAFLFFIKDDTRFLPISPGHFDTGFSILEIDYKTSYSCSWENYRGFIEIIGDIRAVMEETLPMESTPRLIDAHSFVWVVQQNEFINWMPVPEEAYQIENAAEGCMLRVVSGNGERKKTIATVFARSAEVAKETKKRAKGICQYCMKPAPFNDKKGDPFLEVHHVIWLSRGGADSTENTVALCPNCHKRMHILDKQEDVAKLMEQIEQ